jgi:hypothetical protein
MIKQAVPRVGDLFVRGGEIIEVTGSRVRVSWSSSDPGHRSTLERQDIFDVGVDEEGRGIWEIEPVAR